MENEIWKSVVGYEGIYEVSNLGRVRSIDRYVNNKSGKQIRKGKLLKIHKSYRGYLRVILSKECKIRYLFVHKLVAQAFIPNPNNYEQIDHLDGDKTNNNANNLEWVTPKENSNRAWKNGQAKYTEERRKRQKIITTQRWLNGDLSKKKSRRYK